VRRRDFITLLGGVAVARPLAARAQSLPEVGFLYTGNASALPSRITAFSDGLRSRGYVEGHNVSVITRTAEWRPDQYEPLTNELVKRNVRVLFAAGPAGVREDGNDDQTRRGARS
jgi:putative ABC transport system substrate-binding protein